MMTAAQLLREQIDDAGYQLEKSLEGMSEQAMDHRATPNAMTPREQVEHLCEAYQALVAHSQGQKHAWGSFKIEGRATGPLIETYRAMRQRAADAVLSADSEDAIRSGTTYIVAHDYYHVGQICQARLACQPDWNPYAIYRF